MSLPYIPHQEIEEFSTRVYRARTVYFLFQCELINQAACDLAREVANEGDALVAGNFCQTPSYMSGLGKEVVQQEFKKQVDVFVKNDVDFLLGEVIFSVEVSRARNFQLTGHS